MAKTLPAVDRYGAERARDFVARVVADPVARELFPDAPVRLAVGLGQLFRFGCDVQTIEGWLRTWGQYADIAFRKVIAAPSPPAEMTPGAPIAALAASGRPLTAPEFGDRFPMVLDLESLVIPARGVNLCPYHAEHLPLGRFTELRVEKGQLEARGWLSRSHEAGELGRALNQDAWIQASLGAGIGVLEFIPEDEPAWVNERLIKGPCLVARGANLKEISATRDQNARDEDTYITRHVALFSAGRMPSRLALVRVTVKAEQERHAAAENLRAFAEGIEIEQAEKRRALSAVAAQRRTDEVSLREINRRQAVIDAADARRALATVQTTPTGDAMRDAARRQEQEQRETTSRIRTCWHGGFVT
jgi:hypothetical protein